MMADLSVGIALGSAVQIALFVAPLLVLLSYVVGPEPMGLQFWPGAVVMMLIATIAAALAANGGRSAWFTGVMLLMVYAIFALLNPAEYALPSKAGARRSSPPQLQSGTRRRVQSHAAQ
jgi:calcium/proton exchanger cax